MSVLRPLLSRRGRLVFVATALLLIAALVAAPGVSGAKAAVKQFLATIDPTTGTSGVSGTWTEKVTNCGFPVASPCTAASTIGLGSIRIVVPTEFRPFTASISGAPSGKNWTVVSQDQATGNLTAAAVTGSDKLQPGESVFIAITATPTTTACPPTPFTTAAWGSPSVPGTDPFQIQTAQPTVSVAAPGEGCLGSGGTVTGPGGQTETITGNFQGHVLVTFGGDLSCSFDPTFGTQWSEFRLPTQVNITPASDFVAGTDPKISTSRFPTEGSDSSLYLICYAVPKADHPDPFMTRGGVDATTRTVNGVVSWAGILPNCYDPITGTTRPEPCVSEQFLDVTTNPDQIVISVRMPPTDPFKR